MSNFTVKDGHFWLDDQPQLIQAGEFHYFRTPADQWAHRLGLLQQAGFNAVATYIPWLWHQPTPELTDLDGHSHPLRNLSGFLDLAAEMGLLIIARPGPYIMAETINEGVPPWVFEQYPQVAFIGQDGKPQNFASYLHPDFLRCVEGWYQAVFGVLAPRQITRGGKIILIQLDNEMGMLQWVRNLIDTNPDTLARFADYLRQRRPNCPIPDLRTDTSAAAVEDYRRFYRLYLRDYMAHLWNRARAYGMEVPPVLNIHGFANGGKTFPIGLSQLVDGMALDGMISATDVYPIFIGEGNFHQLLLVNEMTKALHNPQQPLFSIEFQAGGNQDFGGAQSSLYDLHSRLCISVGMRAINHYLFYDGENDPVLSPTKRHDWGHPVRKDGTLRRHYARYPQLSRVLAAYGPDLILSRPHTVTTIGFTLDTFMTEVNTPASRPLTDVLTHQREVILFDFVARGLALTHRPFNAVEISRATLDPARMPTLWMMIDKQCDAADQQKLADYVRRGGNLILVGRLCAETFDHVPCTILQESIGVRPLHTDAPFTPARITAFGYADVPVSFQETYTGDLGTVFATSATGEPVGFIKSVGAGRVMMLGAALAANTLEDLDILHQMAAQMDCPPAFAVSDWADVRLSEGENGAFLFVNNYQDDPITTTISAGGVPLFGGNPITLPARRGAILPLEWRPREGIMIHYCTAEVTAVSDDGAQITMHAAGAFTAEISLEGYACDPAQIVGRNGQRVTVQSPAGSLTLQRLSA
jgi:beta-galactosidase